MRTVAILGAGELGATLARGLAERELARRVALVDADEGKAKGKALDIAQSGPVEGFDCAIEGHAELKQVGPLDALVVADPPELVGRVVSSALAGDLARALVPVVGRGILLVAGPEGPALVEAAVERGLSRSLCLGSSPVALAAALRRRLAAELDAEAREVSATVLGLPPDHLVLPQGAATLGGVPVERLSAVAARRALAAVRGRSPGPAALAAAALRVLRALSSSRATVLPVVAFLEGEYGHRGVALAVPARLRARRLEAVVEFTLDPIDRVLLDTAAQRRLEAAG